MQYIVRVTQIPWHIHIMYYIKIHTTYFFLFLLFVSPHTPFISAMGNRDVFLFFHFHTHTLTHAHAHAHAHARTRTRTHTRTYLPLSLPLSLSLSPSLSVGQTVAEQLDAKGSLVLLVADKVVRLPHRLPLALTRLPAAARAPSLARRRGKLSTFAHGGLTKRMPRAGACTPQRGDRQHLNTSKFLDPRFLIV